MITWDIVAVNIVAYDTTFSLLRASTASLSGARTPHVPSVHSGFSGSVRLALEPLMTRTSRVFNASACTGTCVPGKQINFPVEDNTHQ